MSGVVNEWTEDLEDQIDRLPGQTTRNVVRGGLATVDLPATILDGAGVAVEDLYERAKGSSFDEKYADSERSERMYSLGGKSISRMMEDADGDSLEASTRDYAEMAAGGALATGALVAAGGPAYLIPAAAAGVSGANVLERASRYLGGNIRETYDHISGNVREMRDHFSPPDDDTYDERYDE